MQYRRTAEELKIVLDECENLNQMCERFEIKPTTQNRDQLRIDFEGRLGISIDKFLAARWIEHVASVIAESTSISETCRNLGYSDKNGGARKRVQKIIAVEGIDTSHWKNQPIPADVLAKIVPKVTSVYAVAKALGRKPSVDINLTHLRDRIAELGYDTSHFVRGANPRPNTSRRIPNEELFVDGRPYTRTHRRRIISDQLLSFVCAKCGNLPPNNDPNLLEVDHINGRTDDNRVAGIGQTTVAEANLRLVCPGCHRGLETTGSRNHVYQRLQKEAEEKAHREEVKRLEEEIRQLKDQVGEKESTNDV